MTKDEFIDQLRKNLSGLPKEEIDDRISFYEEMIDDKIQDGYKEEDVISDLGSPDKVAREIIGDVPLRKIIKERVTPKRSLKAWEIVLIILGFPIWFPLVLAILIIFLSGFIVIWSLMLSIVVVDISFVTAGGGAIGVGFMTFFNNSKSFGTFEFGIGIFSIGLGLLLVFFTKSIITALVKVTKKMLVGTKNLVVGKGE
jgi:uncharacterized membrane protein